MEEKKDIASEHKEHQAALQKERQAALQKERQDAVRKEKQRQADVERDAFLEKLRLKSERRDQERELRDVAIKERADYEAASSQQYLSQMERRSDFRAHVHSTWVEGHKTQEEMNDKLAEIYKERLTGNVDRTIESASLRTGGNRVEGRAVPFVDAPAPVPTVDQ